MENDFVFNNYLNRIGYVMGKHDSELISKDEMIAGLNYILKDANADYLKGIINARQITVITRFIYYETKED